MWILVLVFIIGKGGSITAIPDFKSKESCIETGEQWKDEHFKNYTYKCIYKSK